jgi:hypothetical protein
MSLDLLAVQDEITNKLKELPQAVYETEVPSDSKLTFASNGLFNPYMVIEFSEMQDGSFAGGILSSKYDVKTSYIIVSCVGPTERSSRQIAGLVRNKLTGFIPNDAGELRLSGGQSYTSSDSKTNRFISEVAFTFVVNTVW